MKNTISILSPARARGISLIEGVLYLVIALAVITGGIVFFQQAQLSSAVTDTSRAAVGISSQARGLYSNQRSFGTADMTPALIASGSVPSTFVNDNATPADSSDDTITHPFGGLATVTGNTAGFIVSFADLSEAACLRLATVGNGGDGPLGTGIEGIEFVAEAATATGTPETLPITAADAALLCGADVDIDVYYNR